MTPEHLELARQAYGLWRGSHRHGIAPAHWDDLGEPWKDAFAMVAGHAQIVPSAENERLRGLVKAAYDEGTSHGESHANAYEWGCVGDRDKTWEHSEAKAALDATEKQSSA